MACTLELAQGCWLEPCCDVYLQPVVQLEKRRGRKWGARYTFAHCLPTLPLPSLPLDRLLAAAVSPLPPA